MNIKFQRIERQKKINDIVYDVVTSDIMFFGNFDRNKIDKDAILQAFINYCANVHGAKPGTYFVVETDDEENYIRYIASFKFDCGCVNFTDNADIRYLCELANDPLNDIEKLSIMMPIVSNYNLTDYVLDMVSAKVRQIKSEINN